jgi:WhiB family redox-sensing transcriptional regulator
MTGDWTERAECRGATPVFYPPDTRRRQTTRGAAKIAAAKAICAICPVRAECLQHALDNGETDGIWGGLTAEERHPLLRGDRLHVREPLPGATRGYINHGTEGGYKAHRARGEDPCVRCKQGHSAANQWRERCKREQVSA